MSSHRQAELDGIRALAVVAVVLFHCGVSGFDNGFLGVDVFFVLSGFLITRLLLREHAQSGRIDLTAFWARRARRILPTLVLTLVVTIALTRWLAPPWEWAPALSSARAAALSFSNIDFWRQPGGYFAETIAHQPLLHTWSLGVEEQFYVIWPITIFIALRVRGRRGAAAWIPTAVVASFVVSAVLSSSSPSAAFYLPHSRVWELALGAAVAAVAPVTIRIGDRPRAVIGWIALAVLLYSLTVGPHWTTPVPSALMPVSATVALLVAFQVPLPRSAARALAVAPLVSIGRWSYSWYLFHWPAITFLRIALGRHDVLLEVLISIGSLALAALNWRLLEQRFITVATNTSHRPQARRVVSTGLAVSAALAIAATLAMPTATTATTYDVDSVTTIASGDELPTDELSFDWSGDEGLRTLTDSRVNIEWPCIDFELHSILEPACIAFDGPHYIAVIGDSHASGAAMAVAPLARAAGLGMIVVGQPSCPIAGVEIWFAGARFDDCREWGQRIIDDISANPDRYAAVVWSARSDMYFPGVAYGPSFDLTVGTVSEALADVTAAAALWKNGIAGIARQLSDANVAVVLLHNTPELKSWPSDCIAAQSADECAEPRAALDQYRMAALTAEIAAIDGLTGVTRIDPYDVLCSDEACPVVRGRDVLYRDENHMTPAGAGLLTDSFREALQSVLVMAPVSAP